MNQTPTNDHPVSQSVGHTHTHTHTHTHNTVILVKHSSMKYIGRKNFNTYYTGTHIIMHIIQIHIDKT